MKNKTPLVVVVENDFSLLKALGRLIFAFGYEVEIYTSAELFLLREERRPVDCLVLDINLDGMSGLELQSKIRTYLPDLPIVFISGRDDENTISQALAQKCVAYLHKPFESQSLREVIDASMASALD